MMVAEHIAVRRGNTALLHDVSLRVDAGEVLAVVGPNGAGKSTLLRVLAGDESPSSGSVSLQSRPLPAWEVDALSRARAVLPQHSPLDFDFTVREVVAMGRAPWRGESRLVREQIVASAMASVGMSEFFARRYPTLSGGEQQRAHLARVIAQVWPDSHDTDSRERMLLLDEPVASLDPQHQHRTLEIARAMAARAVGVVVVLHDLNLAVQYADRIALLCRGRLVALGPAQTVLDASQLSDVYGTCFEIVPHPCGDCPLVVTRPQARQVMRG
jgi:iron complex transport system ATP-binding protein